MSLKITKPLLTVRPAPLPTTIAPLPLLSAMDSLKITRLPSPGASTTVEPCIINRSVPDPVPAVPSVMESVPA